MMIHKILELQKQKRGTHIRLSKDVIKALEEEFKAMRNFFVDRRMPPQPPQISGMFIVEVEGENIMEII